MVQSTEINFSEVFRLDQGSPSGLVWNINDPRGRNYWVGMVAGHCCDRDKAWRVKYDGSAYFAHRIIYEMHHGEIPTGLLIDHIDGNPSNNNINNLRIVTHSVNNKNSKISSDNTTGVTGVLYNTKTNKYGVFYEYYVAQWTDGKVKNKHFSIKKLGEDEAFKQASDYRDKMVDEMNLRGAGYTERHGK